MHIPDEFRELVKWFDFEILRAFPEAKHDQIGFALDSITASEQSTVRRFLPTALAASTAPGQLEQMFRDSGARTFFETEAQLRTFLEEILRRLGELREPRAVAPDGDPARVAHLEKRRSPARCSTRAFRM
jgi:hypothetical protein